MVGVNNMIDIHGKFLILEENVHSAEREVFGTVFAGSIYFQNHLMLLDGRRYAKLCASSSATTGTPSVGSAPEANDQKALYNCVPVEALSQ
mmetsp:Transcript_4412/g.4876  ORF Transcript_4412/g.4876 Transcript_4412/m.4876 type:complete len:91 (-) Transcript_4412:195-467(-)